MISTQDNRIRKALLDLAKEKIQAWESLSRNPGLSFSSQLRASKIVSFWKTLMGRELGTDVFDLVVRLRQDLGKTIEEIDAAEKRGEHRLDDGRKDQWLWNIDRAVQIQEVLEKIQNVAESIGLELPGEEDRSAALLQGGQE